MRRKTTLAYAVLLALLVCSIIPRAVLAAAHGDFNGDGRISSQDAVWMLRHVLEPQGDAADQSSDFNGDGKVDTQDALYLLRYALRPEAYPLVENHDPVELPGKAATCTEPGLMAGMICRVCEKVLQEQTELPALGHSYEQGVCTRCGEMKISRELQMELLPDGSGYAVVGIGGCTDTGIFVPDTHQGLPVTTVSSQAFTGSGITSVMLGENICIIESCAFYGCGELKEIVILAEEVVFGGSTIVHDCRNLETVYFSGDPVRWARDGFYLDDGVRLILNYGHDYAGESLCPESCTDGGMIRYTCRDCGRIYEQQTQLQGLCSLPGSCGCLCPEQERSEIHL